MRGEPRVTASAGDTFADGLATRSTYELTFPALRDGLADFITVTDAEIADAVRLLHAHDALARRRARARPGSRACIALRERLAGQRVGIVISGGNIDDADAAPRGEPGDLARRRRRAVDQGVPA